MSQQLQYLVHQNGQYGYRLIIKKEEWILNKLDKLQDGLADEMMHQSMYNKFMMDITKPDIRQLFTQLRDGKMQHIAQLQQEIHNMMQQGNIG